jgi:hypothetical protein
VVAFLRSLLEETAPGRLTLRHIAGSALVLVCATAAALAAPGRALPPREGPEKDRAEAERLRRDAASLREKAEALRAESLKLLDDAARDLAQGESAARAPLVAEHRAAADDARARGDAAAVQDLERAAKDLEAAAKAERDPAEKKRLEAAAKVVDAGAKEDAKAAEDEALEAKKEAAAPKPKGGAKAAAKALDDAAKAEDEADTCTHAAAWDLLVASYLDREASAERLEAHRLWKKGERDVHRAKRLDALAKLAEPDGKDDAKRLEAEAATKRKEADALFARAKALDPTIADEESGASAGGKHPVVACTAAELDRLKKAYHGSGAEHQAIAKVIAAADAVIGKRIDFPPRGGQHARWYNCPKCEVRLTTVDPGHHKCGKCGTVYSGEPYDDVIFSDVHKRIMTEMTNAAWAYAVTGDKKYARFAAEVLLGYAERYLKYPFHNEYRDTKKHPEGGHIMEQTLDEGEWLWRFVGTSYDLVHDALSSEERKEIEQKFIVEMLKNVASYRCGKINWQAYHNAGMLWAGAAIGDEKWVKLAIDDAENGFHYQIRHDVTGDGMWYENSWEYHYFTLEALVGLAEGARRLGTDLWKEPTLKKMFFLPEHYRMPDGLLPMFADSEARLLDFAELAEPTAAAGYTEYKDAAFLGLLPTEPTLDMVLLGCPAGHRGTPPHFASELFQATGNAILRAEGDAGLIVPAIFGPYSNHAHLDKLSFILFGYGHTLGVDPGRALHASYNLPIHKRWLRPTIGHNAVVIDKAPQQESEAAKVELFAAKPHCSALGVATDKAYPGTEEKRFLVLTPTYLLVVDELSSEKDRRYDWWYHEHASGVQCEAATKDGAPEKDYEGYEYVQHAKQGATDGPIRVEFAGAPVAVNLVAAAAPGTTVTIGDGPAADPTDRVPLVMLTRHGKKARFVAAIEPVKAGAKAAVTGVSVAEEKGGLKITVARGAAADTVELGGGHKIVVTSGGAVVLQE